MDGFGRTAGNGPVRITPPGSGRRAGEERVRSSGMESPATKLLPSAGLAGNAPVGRGKGDPARPFRRGGNRAENRGGYGMAEVDPNLRILAEVALSAKPGALHALCRHKLLSYRNLTLPSWLRRPLRARRGPRIHQEERKNGASVGLGRPMLEMRLENRLSRGSRAFAGRRPHALTRPRGPPHRAGHGPRASFLARRREPVARPGVKRSGPGRFAGRSRCPVAEYKPCTRKPEPLARGGAYSFGGSTSDRVRSSSSALATPRRSFVEVQRSRSAQNGQDGQVSPAG